MFRRILLGFFWDTYDHLGHILLVNVFWFIFNLLGLTVLYFLLKYTTGFNLLWILLLIPLGIFAVTTAGLFAYTRQLMEVKDNSIKQFFIGMKQYYRKALAIVLIHVFIFILVIVNMNFYIQLRGNMRMVGVVLAGIAFWCGVLVALESLYAFAILVQHNLGIKKTLKRSFLIVLDNLWITIGIFIFLLSFLVLSLFSGVGLVLFMMAGIAMLGNNAIYEIMTKYEKKPEVVPVLAPGEKPTSWKQILDQEKADQEPKWRHDNRGWKDIFRPWDYK